MNDERRTPLWFFNEVASIVPFTIDLAATKENALCSRFCTKEDSAFDHTWKGEIGWCNPPYSRGQLVRWVERALSFSDLATTYMLLPADCSTKAGQIALRHSKAILFISKRLAFDEEKSGAKFANWLVLFGGTRHMLSKLYALDYHKNLGVVL